jgi:hypothetical protein
MYRYPAVAVNKPMAVELSVRRSLINVSFLSAFDGGSRKETYNREDVHLSFALLS